MTPPFHPFGLRLNLTLNFIEISHDDLTKTIETCSPILHKLNIDRACSIRRINGDGNTGQHKNYFDSIKKCEHLEELRLRGLMITSLEGINKLENLKSLSLIGVNMLCRIDKTSNLKSLEHLHIHSTNEDQHLKFNPTMLKRSFKLKHVRLNFQKVNKFLYYIYKLRSLETLELLNTDIRYISDKLTNLSNLSKLNIIRDTWSFGDISNTITINDAVTCMEKLDKLTITNIQLYRSDKVMDMECTNCNCERIA